jgi:hypothetical protein
MATEIKGKIGTKLSETEQKGLDPKKIGKLQAKHPKADVEKEAYVAGQVCPYCGCFGWGVESETTYLYFTCHCCGRVFRA